MTDCVHEKQTQHYKGQWHGFGPVSNCETIIFAVFEQTKRNAARLTASSFTKAYLAKTAQSLARASFLTRVCFDRNIVEPGMSEKGALIGIAYVKVAEVREIHVDIKTNTGTKNVRALCVLDRVDAGDYDGHATAGYAEAGAKATTHQISQAQLGSVRAKIRMDLANIFSEIASPDR